MEKQILLILACGILTQASSVVVAQEMQPSAGAALSGQTQTTKSGSVGGQRSPALTGERRPLYRLHKSDALQIKFAFQPDFDQNVTVQPDGFIALKGLNEMYVEGMTINDMREAVRQAYADVLRDPEINIFLSDFDRPFFIAGGEVDHPGKYELRADITVSEAIALAGGFTDRSKHSQVLLFRRVTPDLVESHLLNIKAMMKSRSVAEDVHLMPGDMLFVPQNVISKIKRFLPTSDMSLYSIPAKF